MCCGCAPTEIILQGKMAATFCIISIFYFAIADEDAQCLIWYLFFLFIEYLSASARLDQSWFQRLCLCEDDGAFTHSEIYKYV